MRRPQSMSRWSIQIDFCVLCFSILLFSRTTNLILRFAFIQKDDDCACLNRHRFSMIEERWSWITRTLTPNGALNLCQNEFRCSSSSWTWTTIVYGLRYRVLDAFTWYSFPGSPSPFGVKRAPESKFGKSSTYRLAYVCVERESGRGSSRADLDEESNLKIMIINRTSTKRQI